MKLLVCGTRRKLTEKDIKIIKTYLLIEAFNYKKDLEIIEGCCPDSPDVVAEDWAATNNIKVHHYPATSGNYLKRNIEMVEACDKVIAFFDGFSYGTSHTIANAVMRNKEVIVVHLDKNKGVILHLK